MTYQWITIYQSADEFVEAMPLGEFTLIRVTDLDNGHHSLAVVPGDAGRIGLKWAGATKRYEVSGDDAEEGGR